MVVMVATFVCLSLSLFLSVCLSSFILSAFLCLSISLFIDQHHGIGRSILKLAACTCRTEFAAHYVSGRDFKLYFYPEVTSRQTSVGSCGQLEFPGLTKSV